MIERLLCILYRGEIDIECRNIRCTGFHHLGTVYVRKGRHAPVYLFVHLNEYIIHVRAVTEAELDGAGTVA